MKKEMFPFVMVEKRKEGSKKRATVEKNNTYTQPTFLKCVNSAKITRY